MGVLLRFSGWLAARFRVDGQSYIFNRVGGATLLPLLTSLRLTTNVSRCAPVKEFYVIASTLTSEIFLQRLPLALCTCDVEGTITQYNQRAVELWGGTPVHGIQRFSGAPRVFDHRGRPLVAAATPVALALKSGAPQCNLELIFERADSTRVSILSNAAPLFDESDRLVGAVDVFQDISDRKRSEEARRTAERVAASLRLGTEVGQEISSSVQNVARFLEALKNDANLSSDAQFYVASAQHELARLRRLSQRFALNPATSTNARPNSPGVDS